MKGPVVILAPNASHPPMDGASYRSWSIAKEFSRAGLECYYFTKEEFLKFLPDGSTEKIQSVRNNRGKNWAALRTLVLGSHYLVEKHLPRLWKRHAQQLLVKIKPNALFITFLWTWDKNWYEPKIPLYLDTHNYDPEWWDNLRRSSRDWMSKRVCDLSCAYALKMLSELPTDTKLTHVTALDRKRYLSHRSDLPSLVLANGCDIQFRSSTPDYTSTRKRLYFLGALNIRISRDGLFYFAERFWPELKDTAEMHVFGSGENSEVEALCASNKWTLHRNLTDEALAKELEQMHYLVLPFSYSAGSKLKLINACGKGIPVIATSHGVSGFESLPPTVFVSEEPTEWKEKVSGPVAPTKMDLAECREFAEKFSWQRLINDTGLLDSI